MKLSEITGQYVAYKQSVGMRFCTEERTLKSFWRALGDIDIADVEPDRVLAFLAGTGPVTRFWHQKREVLSGFYRFAILRG
jgi:integrase/recombinase XerD